MLETKIAEFGGPSLLISLLKNFGVLSNEHLER